MIKYILALLLLLAPTGISHAADTYYVSTSGSDGVSCATARTIGTPKRNIMGASGGLACLVAGNGDTLHIRAGTYSEDLNVNDQTFPSGTSYTTAATIKAYVGETVSIRSMNIVGTTQYLIFDRLIVDGAISGGLNQLVSIGGTAQRIRLTNMEVKNNPAGQLVEINQSASFIEFIGGSMHGADGNPSASPVGGYCFYVLGADNLVELVDMYDCSGYGVHNYSANPGQLPSRNVYRYNLIHAMVQDASGGALGHGILLGSGDENQAYGNIIYGNNGDGVQVSNGATNTKVFNNTIASNNASGLSYGGLVYGTGSATTIKNNILYQNTSNDIADSNGVQVPTFGANNCTLANTGCASTSSPGFVNAGSNDYRLASGSVMVDAGTASIASGITRPFNGSNPEIGAFERFTITNCEVGELATNRIVCNAGMNLNQPIRATNTTGWTWTGGTLSSVAVNANAQLIFTLSGAYGGGASTISYVETTGNVTDSALIGNTLNQRMSAVTTMTVTDNTGGGPAGSVALSHWRVYLLYGSADTAWVGKCAEDSTNCTVAPGSRVWVRGKVLNSSGSTYATFNLSTRWRYNAGSYVALTTSYVNGLKVLGTGVQLSTVVTDGAILTNDLLTSGGTNVAGLAVRSASSIPSVALVNGSELEWAQAIDISPSAVIGDVYEMCPFRDDGTALTCATPVKLTVGSFQGTR